MTRESMRQALATVVVAALFAPAVVAQQARDATPNPTGTSALSGVVLSTDEPAAPIRRAIVTISGAGLGVDRSVVTDDAGRFVFEKLPPGSFTVTATKAAYLSASFGARRPAHPGTPIAVAAGQRVADITLRLARGGVIAGRVHDNAGAPLAGVQVMALRVGDPPLQVGFARPGTRDGVVTDDSGTYRLFGLTPGTYTILALISAASQDEAHRRTVAEVDAAIREAQAKGTAAPATPPPPPAIFTAAPIYYPGTPFAAQATSIEVAAGSSHEDVSFVVDLVRSATIEGIVSPINGPGWGTLVISGNGSGMPLTMTMAPHLFQAPGADGAFKYTNVAPGHYTISAFGNGGSSSTPSNVVGGGLRGAGPGGTSELTTWAAAEVDVDGNDITGLGLTLQPALIATGRLEFDATTTKPPADLTALRVLIQPISSTGTGSSNNTNYGAPQRSASGAVRADGSFEVRGLTPGSYRVTVSANPTSLLTGFTLRSATTSDGRDAADSTLTVAPGRGIDGLVVRMTDRHTELAGALVTPAGRPATDYFVIALPDDRSLWMQGARRIRSTRPATNGQYTFADLPPGNYLLAAVDDLDPQDLIDQKFLESVAGASLKLTLAEGEKKRQDLRLAGGLSYRP